MRHIALSPRVVEAAAVAHNRHGIAFYLLDLDSEIHAPYALGNTKPHLPFIIQNDRQLTEARLVLVLRCRNRSLVGAGAAGVEAPNEMR